MGTVESLNVLPSKHNQDNLFSLTDRLLESLKFSYVPIVSGLFIYLATPRKLYPTNIVMGVHN